MSMMKILTAAGVAQPQATPECQEALEALMHGFAACGKATLSEYLEMGDEGRQALLQAEKQLWESRMRSAVALLLEGMGHRTAAGAAKAPLDKGQSLVEQAVEETVAELRAAEPQGA